MFLDQRLWILYSLKLNGEVSNNKERFNLLISQYPDFFNSMMTLENLRDKKANDLYKRKEQAYEKHLQRLRNHLVKSSWKE